jgi:hypothetical protein
VPYCIDVANACPPEDVGGGSGYEDFLEAMGNPDHPEHDAMAKWHGNVFDPVAFECECVNDWLNGLRFELQGGVARTLRR